MTPVKPKTDWMKYWPVVLLCAGVIIAYVEQRSKFGQMLTAQERQTNAYEKLIVIDSLLREHLKEGAHGNADDRITATEREIAILRTKMDEILRRLYNLDRKIPNPNGVQR